MKVLVTGANGFLGSYVCAALRDSGLKTRAAVRTAGRSPAAAEEILVTSQDELTDWSTAADGVDAVVHLAARAHRPPAAQEADRANYERVNVTNTVNLAKKATEAGVRHFVFLSSIAVNGNTTDGREPFRESDAPSPQTVYARTKHEAECKLAELSAASGMHLTVVRTPLIYGRGAKGSLAHLLQALQRGYPLPLGGVRNRRAFAAAENVASFILHRLRTGSGSGVFIVADDEQVSTTEFVGKLASGLNKPARLFPAPRRVLSGSLGLLGRKHIADSLLGSLEVDTARARATGWAPAIRQADALARLREP